MLVKTTLYLKTQMKERLKQASMISGKSRSALIVLLLKKILQEYSQMLRYNRTIKYQDRLKDHDWCTVHICIYSREYECFLDLRKICKMSVSLLVSIAIDKYLEEIVKNLSDSRIHRGNGDSYLFQNYILMKETIGGVICWKIFWGLPHNLHSIFAQ